MPREKIHLQKMYSTVSEDGRSGQSEQPFVVEVGWHSEIGEVQLATRNTAFPELDASSGWFVDLDRSEINRLIRILRRARDSAFGKDE